MKTSSTAGGQDETDDINYLSWELCTASDMARTAMLGKRRTRLFRAISAHNDSQQP